MYPELSAHEVIRRGVMSTGQIYEGKIIDIVQGNFGIKLGRIENCTLRDSVAVFVFNETTVYISFLQKNAVMEILDVTSSHTIDFGGPWVTDNEQALKDFIEVAEEFKIEKITASKKVSIALLKKVGFNVHTRALFLNS
jgi:hypothetical protein